MGILVNFDLLEFVILVVVATNAALLDGTLLGVLLVMVAGIISFCCPHSWQSLCSFELFLAFISQNKSVRKIVNCQSY